MSPKYPNIKVRLTGTDGNSFAIIGRVRDALKRGGASKEDVKLFVEQAMSSDYNNVLTTCIDFVEVS